MKAPSSSFRSIVRRLEGRVREHPVFAHPVFATLASGGPTRLRAFVVEQYRLSVSLPQALAALYASATDLEGPSGRLPAWKLAKPVMDILTVEYWGTREPSAHSKLFIELAYALGIPPEELPSVPSLQATLTFCARRTRLCRESPFVVGLAALSFANEYSNLSVFSQYLTAVRAINQCCDQRIPLGYFQAHMRDEHADYAQLLEVIEAFAETMETAELEASLRSGADALLDARLDWYHELDRHLRGIPQ